jgi:hypothetical protein
MERPGWKFAASQQARETEIEAEQDPIKFPLPRRRRPAGGASESVESEHFPVRMAYGRFITASLVRGNISLRWVIMMYVHMSGGQIWSEAERTGDLGWHEGNQALDPDCSKAIRSRLSESVRVPRS